MTKEERAAYDKAYRENNRERIKARDKAYRENNREKEKARKKAYCEDLKNDPNTIVEDIMRTEKELEYLDSLYESFYYSMNVFRTAQNGRAKLEHTK